MTPYVTIENGRLKMVADFPITPEGGKAFRATLHAMGTTNVLASSTLDFPEEFGVSGKKLDAFFQAE
jgi:hypothetical protein